MSVSFSDVGRSELVNQPQDNLRAFWAAMGVPNLRAVKRRRET
jgi:hypothetical protein